MQEFQKYQTYKRPNLQQSAPEKAVIIDPPGKLQLLKWRLMSDQIPAVYVKGLPDAHELESYGAGVIITLLCTFHQIQEKLRQEGALLKQYSFLVVAKQEEAANLKLAFSRGAKAVFTFPLDLPKISASCNKELKKGAVKAKVEARSSRVNESRELLCEATGELVRRNEANILNYLQLGVLLVGSDKRVIFANSAFRQKMGLEFRQSEVFGTDLFPQGREKVARVINELVELSIAGGTVYTDVEVVISDQNNDSTPGLMSVMPIEHEGSRIFLVTLSTHRVIKENEDIRARSEQLAVAGKLAAGAVHEIKNPLTSVRGFIQLLQQELRDNPKAEYIDIIISEIDRVNNIVNEFLKLAKPAQPKREACSLPALFEEIRIIMESEAFLKNVVIEERYSQLPPIKIDKEQIKQVLINVIQNSFDAMSEGGKLTIQAEPLTKEKKIKIDFIDTGCGIDQMALEQIFTPFFTTKDCGTGLGLSVSQQILDSHGGKIEISSEAGKGATTTLYLPY